MSIRRYIILAFTSALLLCSADVFAQDDIRKEVKKLLRWEAVWDEELVPGFVLSLIEIDTSFHLAYGNLEEDSLAQDRNFEIGSLSKMFSSLYIDKLLSEGILNGELSLNETLMLDNQSAEKMMLVDLMHHESNFPRRPDFFGSYQKDPAQPFLNYNKTLLLDYVKEHQFEKTFKYSHINLALAEMIVESEIDHSFQTGVNIFLSEIGMKESWYGADSSKIISEGHDMAGRKTSSYIFNSFLASEGMRSSPSEICSFVQEHLLKEHFEAILEDNFEAIHHDGIYFKYPWFRFEINKEDYIYTLSGRTHGHNCQIFVYPRTKTAVLVLANGARGINNLGLPALRMMNNNWKRKSYSK